MPEIWFPNLGIEIAHLDRTAFTLFGRSVYWYGIFIGLAVVIGVWLCGRQSAQGRIPTNMWISPCTRLFFQ